MSAELVTRFKNITPDGGVIELVVWKVPTPVPPTEHGFKYRAVYAKDGVRIDQLVEDFIAAVAARRAT
jgi:hypothetical protein